LQTTLTGSAAVWRGAALVTLGAVSFLAFLWLLLV
jgi:hypothetical protein